MMGPGRVGRQRGRLSLEQSRAPKREPELMPLLGIVGVDAELAEPADAVDHRVAVDAETLGRLADAPAVEQRLEGGDELEAPAWRAGRQRAEHPLDEGAH